MARHEQTMKVPYLLTFLFYSLLTFCTRMQALQNNANLAFQKPTFQSSNGFGGYSSLAVDGNTKTSYGDRSCTHTSQYNYDTWWMVDLQQVYRVSTVKITNRGDCCGNRLRNFNVLVGWGMSLDEAKQGKDLRRCCHHPGQVALGATVTLNCDTIYPARYVMIDKAPNTDPLVLCEVEVYAEPTANEIQIRPIGENKDLIGPIIAEKIFKRAIRCIEFCRLYGSCAQYVYSEISGLCKLYTGTATMTGPSFGSSAYAVDALWKK